MKPISRILLIFSPVNCKQRLTDEMMKAKAKVRRESTWIVVSNTSCHQEMLLSPQRENLSPITSLLSSSEVFMGRKP